MKSIADRADVGIGTLYRRFPTKADLFNAVVGAARRRVQQVAEQTIAEVQPGEAVFEFLRRCVDLPSVWRATISTPPWGAKRAIWLIESAPFLEEIVALSKSAGTLRHDIDATDMVIALKAVRSIADLCDTPETKPSLRFLEVVLDGLRSGHQTLSQSPITIEQLSVVLDRH